jgi:aminoglycoside phosphotransferase (APT) family kinase protein
LTKGAKIGEGGSSEVFLWGSDHVLKLFRSEFAHAAEMEVERTRAVYEAGLRCPRIVEVVTLEGRTGIVFEKIDGADLLEGLRSRTQQPAAIGERLAEVHADVHIHRSSALPTLGQLVADATSVSDEVRHSIRLQLEALPEGTAVCHGDLHPGNVVLSERGPVILDWVNAHSAHPASDVARSVVLMRFQGMPRQLPEKSRQRLKEVRDAVTDAYLERYFSIARVTRDEVSGFLPLTAGALLRHEPDNPEGPLLARIARSEASAL